MVFSSGILGMGKSWYIQIYILFIYLLKYVFKACNWQLMAGSIVSTWPIQCNDMQACQFVFVIILFVSQ